MVQASLNHRRRGKDQTRRTIPTSLSHIVGLPRWTRSRLAFSITVLGSVYCVDYRQHYRQNASAKDTSPPARMFGLRLSSSTRSHRTPASRLLVMSTGDWDMQRGVEKTQPETVQNFEAEFTSCEWAEHASLENVGVGLRCGDLVDRVLALTLAATARVQIAGQGWGNGG